MKLEKMDDFFNKRVDGYETHMMENVPGAEVYYKELAKQIPEKGRLRILDLGCGTGLELDEIFKRNQQVHVSGIDMSRDMLAELRRKFQDKKDQIELIEGSYFEKTFGEHHFDFAVSVQTLHHFSHQQKVGLYKRIRQSLTEKGVYLEADYTARDQAEEDFYLAENRRIRGELGITEGFYHYDTPCTLENQIRLLKEAGFQEVDIKWQEDCTVLLSAQK